MIIYNNNIIIIIIILVINAVSWLTKCRIMFIVKFPTKGYKHNYYEFADNIN